MADDLFARRSPEGAARQLAICMAWLTECQLATLEALEDRKSTSKSELKRQASICDDAVRHCYELGVEPRGVRGHACSRLQARLEALAASGAPK